MAEGVEKGSVTLKPLLKLLLFTLLVPCSVTVWVPCFFLSSSLRWTSLQFGGLARAGMLSIALGTIGYFWCAWDFAFAEGTPAPMDPPKTLVAQGLYRYVRNPMYISILLILLGESLLFKSLILLRYAAIWWIVVYLFVLLYEEPTLRRKFGTSYHRYCEDVPRWIPRILGRNRSHAV